MASWRNLHKKVINVVIIIFYLVGLNKLLVPTNSQVACDLKRRDVHATSLQWIPTIGQQAQDHRDGQNWSLSISKQSAEQNKTSSQKLYLIVCNIESGDTLALSGTRP